MNDKLDFLLNQANIGVYNTELIPKELLERKVEE
jgi:hypothetical protein